MLGVTNLHSRKILVTGASGFVGKAFCAEALERGIQVRSVIRSGKKLQSSLDCFVIDDMISMPDWLDALHGCDAVIHLAARVHIMRETADDPLSEFRLLNVAGTEHLARSASAAGIKRFVYVSSVKVNGEETNHDEVYTELDMAAPQDPYGISKWEAEKKLQQISEETGLEIVIVRPPLVYGAGVKGNFAQLISAVAKGVPFPFASVKNKRSLIYVRNLVDALMLCVTHPKAAGNTYLVSDAEAVSTPELLRKISLAMGKQPRLFPCPSILLKLAAKLFRKTEQISRLLSSLQVDSSKIRRDLGWVPPYSLDDGLKATVKDRT